MNPVVDPVPGGRRGVGLSLTTALSGFSVSEDDGTGAGAGATRTAAERSPSSLSSSSVLTRMSSSVSGKSSSSTSRRMMKKKARPKYYPQFDGGDLSVRLELYVRSVRRSRDSVARGEDDCVLALEPPKAMKARVQGVVMAFLDTVGAVQSMTPARIRLTSAMTRELLGVEDLSNPLAERIRRIA